MKKYFSIIMIVLILLSGCGNATGAKIDQLIVKNGDQSTGNAAKENTKPQKQIALVMKTFTNPFFIEMEKGARKAEAELNFKLIVKAPTTETSTDEQISIVEELIKEKVDAIVISPQNSELIPVLKKAQNNGIAIVNIDSKLDPKLSNEWGLDNVPFISVDNERNAYLAAEFISNRIDRPTDAVIVEGILNSANLEDRKNGALRAFKENNNIKVVATETANCRIDEAYQVTANLYREHPNIGAFFCANDLMALGVIRYLQETGKKNVLVAGYDALDEVKKSIREGWLTVTVDQHAGTQGYLGAKYALEIINGERKPSSAVTLIDAGLVELQNLQ